MANEIYQAFVNAGFKKEAIKLSETVRTEKGPKIRPALGHYIAILDNIIDKPYIDRRLKEMFIQAEYKIEDFLYNLHIKGPEFQNLVKILQDKHLL